MKKIIIFFLVVSCQSVSQHKLSFEEKIMSFKIVKNQNVSKSNFEKGKFIFEQTIKQIKHDSLKFNYVNYWNLAVSFKYLGEDNSIVQKAFNKAYKLNPNEICELLKYLKTNEENKYNEFLKVVPQMNMIDCDSMDTYKDKFDVNNYCKKYKLDKKLVNLVKHIYDNDQKYRKQNYKKNLYKQHKLDSLNLFKIDSLYNKYNTYVGKSLVGNEFSDVMWLVIQHSNINKMEEYLPILLEAVNNKELKLTSLKMLIDRIQT